MKKTLTFLLTAALLISIVLPAYADTVLHVHQDFEGAVKNTGVTPMTIDVPNLAASNGAGGFLNLPWVFTTGTSTSWQVGTVASGGNTSKFLQFLNSSGPAARMTLPRPLGEADGLVYLDFRMAIPSMTATNRGNINLHFRDENDNDIFQFSCANQRIPTITADQVYGANTNIAENTVITYPYYDVLTWRYMRVIMDFGEKTVTLLSGEALDTLTPLIKNTPTVGFKASLDNFAYIQKTSSSGLQLDDIKVYTVSTSSIPTASDVAVSGSIALGKSLTASYGTYSDSNDVAEGDSYGYWEASADSGFANAQPVSAEKLIQAGDTDTLLITEDFTGKYLRYCVVPKNENGDQGEPAYSNGTDFKVNTVEYILSATGSLQGNGDRFDNKDTINEYGGSVTVRSSKSIPQTSILIAAYYFNNELKNIESAPVVVESASDSETGIVEISIPTEAVVTMGESESVDGKKMVIYLWEDFLTPKPLSAAFTVGP